MQKIFGNCTVNNQRFLKSFFWQTVSKIGKNLKLVRKDVA